MFARFYPHRRSARDAPCKALGAVSVTQGRHGLRVCCGLLISFICAGTAMGAPPAPKRSIPPLPPAVQKAPTQAPVPIPAPLASTTELDLERYMGLWYKVAKVDEPHDALRTRERYEFLQRYDGGVRVIATSYDPLTNRWDRRQDYMAPVDAKGGAFSNSYQLRLPVHFSISRFGPFGVNYHVVALDPQYQWAMMTGPGPQSFFILSRRNEVSPGLRTALEQLATRLNLVKTPLTWPGTDQETTTP